MDRHVFISHASKDDNIVRDLRERLELNGFPTWVDSRELNGGDILSPEIENGIRSARRFMAVLSMEALGSDWVQKEVALALDEADKRADGYKVIPVVLPGLNRNHLKLLFKTEPVYIFIEDTPIGLSDVMPEIFEALGQALPRDRLKAKPVRAEPVEELVLRLTDPVIVEEKNGARRAEAIAVLTYCPADAGRNIESLRYKFKAPLGPIELGELRWYIERYYQWPTGVFKERAEKLEASLPKWG